MVPVMRASDGRSSQKCSSILLSESSRSGNQFSRPGTTRDTSFKEGRAHAQRGPGKPLNTVMRSRTVSFPAAAEERGGTYWGKLSDARVLVMVHGSVYFVWDWRWIFGFKVILLVNSCSVVCFTVFSRFGFSRNPPPWPRKGEPRAGIAVLSRWPRDGCVGSGSDVAP